MISITDKTIKSMIIARDGNYIIRNHTTPTSNPLGYLVGTHTAGMIQLAFLMFPDEITVELLKAITFHDAGFEGATGDIVGAAKYQWPYLNDAVVKIEEEINKVYDFIPELTSREEYILKILDLLDLYFYCVEQESQGVANPRFRKMKDRVYKKILSVAIKQNESTEIRNFIYNYETMYHEGVTFFE